MRKFHLKFFGFVVLLLVTFSLGFFTSSWIRFSPGLVEEDTESFFTTDETGESKLDLSLFWQVLSLLNENYLRKEDIKTSDLLYGAVSGLVASLDDPYTSFYSPEQNEAFKESLEGIYEGIGAQLGFRDSQLVIVAPLNNGPAKIAGVQSGDAILAVDGESTVGWGLPEAVKRMRGEQGTEVVLTLVRSGGGISPAGDQDHRKSFDVTIKREQIKVPNIILEWKEGSQGKIAYLKIFRFGTNVQKDWNEVVREMQNAKYQISNGGGLILDLRNNPGGFLEGAIVLGSDFFSDGLVVKRRAADGEIEDFTVKKQGRLVGVPVVVLVNEGSASASEILAGAIQVRRRGKLVGEKTFGKGTVQEAFDLSEGAGIHITNAEWLLPDGSSIDGVGLEVDVKIEMGEDHIKAGEDPQLEKAMELLLEGF